MVKRNLLKLNKFLCKEAFGIMKFIFLEKWECYFLLVKPLDFNNDINAILRLCRSEFGV